jgi:hypothetical protein
LDIADIGDVCDVSDYLNYRVQGAASAHMTDLKSGKLPRTQTIPDNPAIDLPP